MKVKYMVYGFVSIETAEVGLDRGKHYFATPEARDEAAMLMVADRDCKCYGFEYEEEVEV